MQTKTISTPTYITLSVSAFIAIAFTVIVPTLTEAATLNRQLELGMSGSDVSDLQTFLAQDPTIYPQGPALFCYYALRIFLDLGENVHSMRR